MYEMLELCKDLTCQQSLNSRIAYRQSLPVYYSRPSQARPSTSQSYATNVKAHTPTAPKAEGVHLRHLSHEAPLASPNVLKRSPTYIPYSTERGYSRAGSSMRTSEVNVSALHRSNSQRRQSISETYHTPPARIDGRRRSWLSHMSNHTNYNSSPPSVPLEEQAPPHSARSLRVPRMDDPESVGSTTAPSTVWDDLDELKSRVRHLEGSGKTRHTPNIATSNVSGDRPRTATTSGTTVSSSPRQNRKPSIMPAETFGSPDCANVHPLLHSALFKAKGVLNPTIYRALETSSIDALELAATTGSSTSSTGMLFTGTQRTHSMPPSSSFSDRHLRRKTDGLCRGLTELCIALCEARNTLDKPSQALTRSDRDVSAVRNVGTAGIVPPLNSEPSSAVASLNKRSTSLSVGHALDSPSRISPSRALDRVEARRSSLAALGVSRGIAGNGNTSSSRIARRTTIDANSPITLQNQYSNQSHHGINNSIPNVSIDNVSKNRPTPSRLSRAGTSLLLNRRRTTASVTADIDPVVALSTDDEEASNGTSQRQQKQLLRHRYDLRAPSRALTEFGRLRPWERDREREKAHDVDSNAGSRDNSKTFESKSSKGRTMRTSLSSRTYTSQHPLPDQPTSSPMAQSFFSSSVGPKASNMLENNNGNGNGSNVRDHTGLNNHSSSTSTSSLLRVSNSNSSDRRFFGPTDQASPSISPSIHAPDSSIAHASMRHNINNNVRNDSDPSETLFPNIAPRRSAPIDGSADEWPQKLAILGSSGTSTRTGTSTAKTMVSAVGGGGSRSAFSRLSSGRSGSKAASIAG